MANIGALLGLSKNSLVQLDRYERAFSDGKHQLSDYHRAIEKGDQPYNTDVYSTLEFNVRQARRRLADYIKAQSDAQRADQTAGRTTTVQIHDLWLENESIHTLWEVSMILRYDFHEILGIQEYNRVGYFLDRDLNRMIHEYMYSVDYADGGATLAVDQGRVSATAVSTDGRYLFAGGGERSIQIWDLTTNKLLGILNSENANVRCMDYRFGLLVTGGANSAVRIFDAYSLELIQILRGHTGYVYSVQFNEAGDKIVTSSADCTVRIWCVRTGECLMYLLGHENKAVSAHFWNDLIISGSHDRSIKLWDPATAQDYRTMTEGIRAPISKVCLNCDESLIVCVAEYISITVFSLPEFTPVNEMSVHCSKCCFHPTMPSVLAITENFGFSVKLCDVISGENVYLFRGEHGRIDDLTFTPDGLRLICVSQNQSVHICDVSFIQNGFDMLDYYFHG